MSLRICRLFFWIAGAPMDRPGGPWWYEDFLSDEQRDQFMEDVRHCLHKYVYCDVRDTPYKVDEASKGVLYVQPPQPCAVCDGDGPRGRCSRCGWS